MDYRDGYIWLAVHTNWSVKRFLPDGSGVETYSTPQPQDNLSGLTTFPLGSDAGIILTSYYADKFFFYRYDGSSLAFLGAVDIPLWTNFALGLAYSASRDSFYYSYTDGATHTISEMDIDIVLTSIEETTWGQIKAM
ncbi:hypothetical protein K8R78_07755 [bacterium]|nr:hypothetical protein [bacterium]